MPEDREGDLKNNLYLLVISKKYENRPQSDPTPFPLRPVPAGGEGREVERFTRCPAAHLL